MISCQTTSQRMTCLQQLMISSKVSKREQIKFVDLLENFSTIAVTVIAIETIVITNTIASFNVSSESFEIAIVIIATIIAIRFIITIIVTRVARIITTTTTTVIRYYSWVSKRVSDLAFTTIIVAN